MLIRRQYIGLYTLVRRELRRIFSIAAQTFLPPLITNTLYFIIFGTIIGQRIGMISGHPYAAFIAPGLILMSVMTNAYNNVVSSLYIARFQRSIEELLVSPMHWSLIFIGFLLGGMMRGMLTGLLIISIAHFFTSFPLLNLGATCGIMTLVCLLFSMAGFLNGMLARTFDEISIIPTFILTPLMYLGGMFYTTAMLPPFWRNIVFCNPIFYMINALRTTMLGDATDVPLTTAIEMMSLTIFILMVINIMLMRKGIGMRT